MNDMNEKIQEVRVATQAGIMRCKGALVEAEGDVKAAINLIRSRGEAISEQNYRPVNQGAIGSYLHSNKQVAALVELSCETDFVARNPEFQDLAHNLAMHVAATNPSAIYEDKLEPEKSLMNQEYIKDNTKNISDLLVDARIKFGEAISVRNCTRMKVGE